MKHVMLKCGCMSNAVRTVGDKMIPSCVIHDCIEPAENPDVSGRMAKCAYCGSLKPSAEGLDGRLAFFQFNGEGSRRAREQCKNCGYYLSAHDPEQMAKNVPSNRRTVVEQGKCKGFEPHGAFEFDEYYCGCEGWD